MSKANYSFKWNQSRISQVRGNTLKAMVTAAIDVSNNAKRGAPVDTGALVNSIRVVNLLTDKAQNAQALILAGGKIGGKKIAYAKYREYNNRKNPQTKFYMFKAFKNLEQNYPKYFKEITK